MKLQTFILSAIFILLSSTLYAQDLEIKSFQKQERDLLARTQERLDLNDEPCAVVRISVAKAKNFVFEGNILGEITYNPGEAIVYMPAATHNITIKSEEFGLLRYEFPQRLEKSVVYKLELKLIISEDKKIRTLVMPVVGIGETMSYGAMIGVVKKTGAYVKVKYNFQNLDSQYECDKNGVITPINITSVSPMANISPYAIPHIRKSPFGTFSPMNNKKQSVHQSPNACIITER